MELYKMVNVGRTCQFDVVDLMLWPTAGDTAYDWRIMYPVSTVIHL